MLCDERRRVGGGTRLVSEFSPFDMTLGVDTCSLLYSGW